MLSMKCIKHIEMSDGAPDYFTINKYYFLYTLDNETFFTINDENDIHILPWPHVEEGFDTNDYFQAIRKTV